MRAVAHWQRLAGSLLGQRMAFSLSLLFGVSKLSLRIECRVVTAAPLLKFPCHCLAISRGRKVRTGQWTLQQAKEGTGDNPAIVVCEASQPVCTNGKEHFSSVATKNAFPYYSCFSSSLLGEVRE